MSSSTVSRDAWSIDRTKEKVIHSAADPPDITKQRQINPYKKNNNFPKDVVMQVVKEVLGNVADSDWNDPLNVCETIAKMMSIDPNEDIEKQTPEPNDNVIRAVITKYKNVLGNKTNIPYWVCQSIIRVDGDRRFVECIDSSNNKVKYNKIDIVVGSQLFSECMDKVAKYAKCTWNYRWGGSSVEENKLFRVYFNGNESWIDKCIEDLNCSKNFSVDDLVMVEFKRAI
jgi:hypothetical protein